MNGWIKLHRSILNNPIWLDATPEQKVIMITMLLMANYEEEEWEWGGETYSLQPGQFVTSIPSLLHRCGRGMTEAKLRTTLKKCEKHGFLTDKSTNKNRVITLVNWAYYQGNDVNIADNNTDKERINHGKNTASKKERNKNKRKDLFANEFKLDLTKGEAI